MKSPFAIYCYKIQIFLFVTSCFSCYCNHMPIVMAYFLLLFWSIVTTHDCKEITLAINGESRCLRSAFCEYHEFDRGSADVRGRSKTPLCCNGRGTLNRDYAWFLIYCLEHAARDRKTARESVTGSRTVSSTGRIYLVHHENINLFKDI